MRHVLLLIIVLGSSGTSLFARETDSTTVLQQKLWNYISQHPFTNLFVHTDKNIYSPNERIWFKAYMLAGLVIDSKVLYVRLLNADKKLMLSTQYPIYDIRAHGDLLLPDTLKDGNYYLYAYADRMINFSPADVFLQPIRIYRNSKRWRATAYIRDTSKLKRGNLVDIVVQLKQNNDLVKGVKGHYQLLNGTKVVKQGGLKTNIVGESFISFTYPDIGNSNILTAKIFFEDEYDFEEILLTLGHEGNTVSARVFPEGGHAIEGVVNNMAVAITDVNKNAVAEAFITVRSGNRAVASATTNASGVATIAFMPKAAEKYDLEIQSNSKSQTIPFPVVIETKGYVLKATAGNEKSQVTIYNHNETEQVRLVARSLEEVWWSKSLKVPVNSAIAVDVLLDTFPKEVIAIDLLDTSGKTLAERLWINKKEDGYKVQLTCDKAQYGKRKKVTVTITATDNAGQPIKINSSVAVTEIHTVDTATIPDIAQYYLFKNTGLSLPALYNKKYSLDEINACLMTGSWVGYEWNTIQQYEPRDGLRIIKNTDGVYGTVKPIDKKKTVELKELTILSKEGIGFVSLNEYGNFDIPSLDLISPRNNRKNLLLGNSFYEKYAIQIRRYDQDYDKLVIQYGPLYPSPVFNTVSLYKTGELEKITNPHQLQNVIVRRTKDIPWQAEEYKSRDCMDWVCMYNILNCPNHKFGSTPVEGEIYTFFQKKVVYRGCGETESRSVIPLKLVYTPNIFPVTDFEKESSVEEEFRSTVYWNPNTDTDADGKATITFFTNDIASVFKIRLQGVTIHGLRPLSVSQTFTVK